MGAGSDSGSKLLSPTLCDEAAKDGAPGLWRLESHISEEIRRVPGPVSPAPFMVRPERPEGWPEAMTPGCSSRRASARRMRSRVPQSMAWMGASELEPPALLSETRALSIGLTWAM